MHGSGTAERHEGSCARFLAFAQRNDRHKTSRSVVSSIFCRSVRKVPYPAAMLWIQVNHSRYKCSKSLVTNSTIALKFFSHDLKPSNCWASQRSDPLTTDRQFHDLCALLLIC